MRKILIQDKMELKMKKKIKKAKCIIHKVNLEVYGKNLMKKEEKTLKLMKLIFWQNQ